MQPQISYNFSAKTKLFAVIGDPIEHSMSPKMHNSIIQDLGLDYIYLAFKVSSNQLKSAVDGFRALDIKGINVTIPHKIQIMQYLDEIDPIAKNIGAINTIKNEDGFLKARNTDGEGAVKAIKDAGFNLNGMNVAVIGTGGASRAISFVLAKEINQLTLLNRSQDSLNSLSKSLMHEYDLSITSELLTPKNLKKIIPNVDLIINTTPIGMHPNFDVSPLDASYFHSDLIVYDIVYNPLETKLLRDAKSKGCKTISGLDMFVNQGAVAFEWWTGKSPNKDIMREVVIKHLEGFK